MIESSDNKKKIFYFTVLILTLITMIVGAVFAIYSLLSSQKEEGTVLYTGKLEIDYKDGIYIKNPKLYPVTTVDYNTTNNVYRNCFTIESTGNLDMTMRIDLEITNNEFEENGLKYAVYNNTGKLLKSGYVVKSGTMNLADNVYLPVSGIATYTLIIWLDNKDYNQDFEFGKTITGKINVYGQQIKY